MSEAYLPPTIDYSYISAMTIAAVDVEAHSRQSQANLMATESAVQIDSSISSAQANAIIAEAGATADAAVVAISLNQHNAQMTIDAYAVRTAATAEASFGPLG